MKAIKKLNVGLGTVLRFALPLLIVLGLAALVLSPVAESITGQWFRHDVEMRSGLAFNTVSDSVRDLIRTGNDARIGEVFHNMAMDERLMGVAFCSPMGKLRNTGGTLPSFFDCAKTSRIGVPSYTRVESDGLPVLEASFPLLVDGVPKGHIVIFHDLGYVENRAAEIRWFLGGMMVFMALLVLGVTLTTANMTLGRWMRSVRAGLSPSEAEDDTLVPSPEIVPLVREIKQLMRDFDGSRRLVDDARIQWTPNTLHLILENELPGAEVLVVSNREPYIHNHDENGAIVMQTPASGLVAAMEPVTVACSGTWIAHGSGTADAEMVDNHDRLSVPPDNPAYTLRRVWLSEQEQEGYYYGFANEGMWPLCHLAYVRPTFRESDWETYVRVNRKFADAVITEAKSRHPIVLIQDYHFALLPRMIKERLPDATIITFWHIPWPNAEAFGICPWRDEVLRGMLGSSILGFHTQFHCNNFLETADRFLESRIDRERMSVTVGGTETLVRPYPISIEWPPKAMEDQALVSDCAVSVRQRFGLPAGTKLAVGIERFDYTKGILDRMRAVDRMLIQHPEWRGKFSFIQAAAPTRTKLGAYKTLQDEAVALAEEINERHQGNGAPPIILSIRHHEAEEVFELYRAADLCVVSSLHDGMNLVAKEFVAARDDEQGVLVLSTFAGASRELIDALIVNPYDTVGMADAILHALIMPGDEQRERMRMMREIVAESNVYRWAGRMLLDAARMRKRRRIAGLVANTGV